MTATQFCGTSVTLSAPVKGIAGEGAARTCRTRESSRTGRNQGSKAGPSCHFRFVSPHRSLLRRTGRIYEQREAFASITGRLRKRSQLETLPPKRVNDLVWRRRTTDRGDWIYPQSHASLLNHYPEKSVLQPVYRSPLIHLVPTSDAGLHLSLFCTVLRLLSSPLDFHQKTGVLSTGWFEDTLWKINCRSGAVGHCSPGPAG